MKKVHALSVKKLRAEIEALPNSEELPRRLPLFRLRGFAQIDPENDRGQIFAATSPEEDEGIRQMHSCEHGTPACLLCFEGRKSRIGFHAAQSSTGSALVALDAVISTGHADPAPWTPTEVDPDEEHYRSRFADMWQLRPGFAEAELHGLLSMPEKLKKPGDDERISALKWFVYFRKDR